MERIIEDVRAKAFWDERLEADDIQRPTYIDDLEWRWQYAHGDMVPPSNMGAIIAAIESGAPTHSDKMSSDIDGRSIFAAEKISAIDDALNAILPEQRDLLFSLYGTADGVPDLLLKTIPTASRLYDEKVTRRGEKTPITKWFVGISNEDRIWGHPAAHDVYEAVLTDAVRQAREAARAYKSAVAHRKLAQKVRKAASKKAAAGGGQ